ncbi:MAG TPA: VOC family protein [Dongiaceae bacterium]|nr:VOC family protein [Dongiaceae bacterium]
MRVDHLVWYAGDLADGERQLARLDSAPVYGGVHPGEGTCNSLLSLGPATYLEILAHDPAQPASALDPEIAGLKGQGLYHWAAGGVDLAPLTGRARAAGLIASDVVSGGRAKPDGTWLGWRLLGIRDHGFGALVPFFIDWGDGAHPASTAPRGGRLASLELISPRAAALRDLFKVLELDFAIAEGEKPGITATLEGAGGMLRLDSFDPLPRGYVI